MNDKRKLFFAIVAGAGLSLLCCIAFTALTSSRASQEQQAKIGYEADARQSAPPLSSVADNETRLERELERPVMKTSAVVARPTKTAKASKTATALHRQRPRLKMSLPAANAPQAAVTQLQPELQSGDAGVSIRMVTAIEARAALKELGTNPAAEAVWTAAINDANIPAKQRKDLIEDLNEEGFADPKHLTLADLPRIENRLALIEELAPQAMDQTNADAFQEAYKDLNNMRDGLARP